MRAPSFSRSLRLLVLVTTAALTACAANDAGAPEAPTVTDVGATTPLPGAGADSSPSDGGADGADGATPRPKNDCKLSALTGVATIAPTMLVHAPPGTVPPTMTGGMLQGEYRVDHATVFLPSASAGLIDTKKSTGTINAWAVFDGTNYRLYLKAEFHISSVLGAQTQGTDTASQGAFAVSGAALTLDHACDTALTSEADYSFTDNGSGRATILIKTPSPYGDTYLQLDAARN